MMGQFIGSAPAVYQLGEYMAFFAVGHSLATMFRDRRAHYRDQLIRHLISQAHVFAESKAREQGAQAYVDDTPLNSYAWSTIDGLDPRPLYICMVRGIGGVVESLKRSYQHGGYEWAGKSEQDRVTLWKNFYSKCSELPADRSIFISYEGFVRQPEAQIETLLEYFSSHRLDLRGIKKSVLTDVYAGGAADNGFLLEDLGLKPSAKQLAKIEREEAESKAILHKYADQVGALAERVNRRVRASKP